MCEITNTWMHILECTKKMYDLQSSWTQKFPLCGKNKIEKYIEIQLMNLFLGYICVYV